MDPIAYDFVHALLRCGVTLTELLGDLVEECEANAAFPGEDAAAVLVEMAAGSVAVHLRRVPERDIERATDLMVQALDAVLADLRTAAEVARRRQAGYRVA